MLVPKSKFKSSWKSFEPIKIENLEQFNETEYAYQIEEVEAYEPKMEVLNESSALEVDEIKVIDNDEIDISNDLEHSTLNLSEDEQQTEEVLGYDVNSNQFIHSCNKCEFASEIQEEYNNHMLLHKTTSKRYSKLFCSRCSYQFTNQAHFTAHNNGHKLFDTLAKYMNYPKCQACNVMFVDDECYEIHALDHNLVPIESLGFFLKFGLKLEDQQCEEDERTLKFDENYPKCGHCLKTFNNDQELVNHLLIFHAKTLTCPVDFRNFNNNQAFTIHMRNNHAELFPNSSFTCSVCKNEFETLYEKLSHMKNCKEKSFNCLHCQKTFSRKCHLVKHLKLVSGELNITCEICNKICRDKHDYKIHSRSHSSEKLFKCSLCSKSYKTSSARAAHLQTHLETFICTYCNIQFKSRRTMQKHVKNKHDKEITINGLQEIEIY